jgi:hypothetical protein
MRPGTYAVEKVALNKLRRTREQGVLSYIVLFGTLESKVLSVPE